MWVRSQEPEHVCSHLLLLSQGPGPGCPADPPTLSQPNLATHDSHFSKALSFLLATELEKQKQFENQIWLLAAASKTSTPSFMWLSTPHILGVQDCVFLVLVGDHNRHLVFLGEINRQRTKKGKGERIQGFSFSRLSANLKVWELKLTWELLSSKGLICTQGFSGGGGGCFLFFFGGGKQRN